MNILVPSYYCLSWVYHLMLLLLLSFGIEISVWWPGSFILSGILTSVISWIQQQVTGKKHDRNNFWKGITFLSKKDWSVFRGVLKAFQGSLEVVSRMFQGSFKEDSRVFHGQWKSVFRKIKGHSKGVLGGFLRSSEEDWRWSHFKVVSRLFQKSSKGVSRKSQTCFKNVSRLF